jgi:hypothetical protein
MYIVKYKEHGKPTEIEIKIETSDEGESTVTCNDDSVMVIESRLPTTDQFLEYAKYFLPEGSQASNPNTGLFITKNNESQTIDFYKLNNKKISQILKDGTTIDIGDIGSDLSINGIYITHVRLDETEPILIPESNPKFTRTRAMRRRPIKTSHMTTNAANALPPLHNEMKVNYDPIHDAHQKKNSSTNKNPVNVSTLYSTPQSKINRAPPLPPRKGAPYQGPGPKQFM